MIHWSILVPGNPIFVLGTVNPYGKVNPCAGEIIVLTQPHRLLVHMTGLQLLKRHLPACLTC